jgi:hypothetical protein
MMPGKRIVFVFLCGLSMTGFISGPVVISQETKKAKPPTPEQIQFFESKVRPVLAAN